MGANTNRYRRATFPLFHLSKILGLLPCNHQFHITSLAFGYAIILSLVIGVIPFYIQLSEMFRSPKITISAHFVLVTISRFLRFIVIPSHLIGVYRKRFIFERILRGTVLTDFGTLSSLTYPNKYTMLGVIYIGLSFAIPIARSPSWSTLISSTLGFCQFSAIYCLAMLFCTFVEIVKLKMSCQIRSLANKKCKFDLAIEVHQELIKESRKCNKLFTLQLLTLQFFLSYQFVYTTYSVIVNAFQDDYNRAAGFFMSTILSLGILLVICTACEDVHEEAEKFNLELFKLMRESKDLCRNEKLQLYVTMKQTINFTACGFFTLGYPLVTSIIAAATTYLVILVQFSMPQKP